MFERAVTALLSLTALIIVMALSPLFFIANWMELKRPGLSEEDRQHSIRALWMSSFGLFAWSYIILLVFRR